MDFLRRLFGKSGPDAPPPETATPASSGTGEQAFMQICRETLANGYGMTPLGDSPRWQALMKDTEARQVEALRATLRADPEKTERALSIANLGPHRVEGARNFIAAELMRLRLPFDGDDLMLIVDAWQRDGHLEVVFPAKPILSAVERLAAQQPLSAALRASLKGARDAALRPRWADQPPTRALVEIADRIDRLLGEAPEQANLPNGPFADDVRDYLETLDPDTKTATTALMALAADAGDKAKPSRKWLDSAKAALDAAGLDAAEARTLHWLSTTTPDPSIIDLSLDILKGLVWASVLMPGPEVAGALGRFCEKCFRKVPNFGARSVKLGNAALWALSERASEPMAAAELIRLRSAIKYPSARKLIESRLAELADKTGQSVEALEDLSLPDFGLDDDGVLVTQAGDATATIRLTATDTDLSWQNAAGKAVKAAPANIKSDHASELTAVRNRAKEIETARASQALRLEASWLEDRSWTFSNWARHFRDHPLRRPIVASLIWKIGGTAVMTAGDGLRDVEGRPVTPSPDAEVRLWHPLDARPEEVLAWRGHIVTQGITQPVKQAHREIYVLTDAERRTHGYSNRFAAHILRQHQFRALCHARGWSYGLMGGWDSFNIPERVLPRVGLTVQYSVEAVEGRQTEAAIALHLATDQVRFLDAHHQPVALVDVPPIVFSEALRDVDLFVAVTSVANDPGWTDGGPAGRFGGYWREWAFGELGQSAETRKELIAQLAPRLSIRDRLEISGKFLVVTGKRQKYAIHFGSGNIQILPDNRYLCIVPDRAPSEANGLKLPFTGDGTLSTILAKAFLLVDEDKITDRTILTQL